MLREASVVKDAFVEELAAEKHPMDTFRKSDACVAPTLFYRMR